MNEKSRIMPIQSVISLSNHTLYCLIIPCPDGIIRHLYFISDFHLKIPTIIEFIKLLCIIIKIILLYIFLYPHFSFISQKFSFHIPGTFYSSALIFFHLPTCLSVIFSHFSCFSTFYFIFSFF